MTEKQAIRTDQAPKPAHAFPQGIRKGPIVQVSGQGPVDPESGEYLYQGDIKAQTRRVLENLTAIVTAGGAGFDDIVMLRVYVTDRAHFAGLNEAYAEFVEKHTTTGVPYPSRTTVVCDLPRPEMLVEIDAMAVVD
ncbi:RidA family protein [Haloglycomyces albus]|uniref:RidA family protein n=1 Tax=Haloglycomyces albus TaxID=526067 RepID=UPI00046C931D|nr:RidA family protein [Haloglycomyces albus]